MTDNSIKKMLERLLVAIVFSIAFGYIESAVVVDLRAIFHPNGFHFPMQVFALTAQGKHLLLTEVGREAATLVLILTAAWLFSRNRQEAVAYFMLIFAVWDIFYYVWLKVLLDWPATLMDWDVLFLIPVAWAAPILYPVLVSLTLFALAVAILYRSAQNRPLVVTPGDWLGWMAAAIVVVVSFCLAGLHIDQTDYARHFDPVIFAIGYAMGVATSVRSWRRSPVQAFADPS
jgi:hypothetical protein